MKAIVLFIALLMSCPAIGQADAMKNWSILARIKLETKLNEEHNTYVWVPVMDQRATNLEGRDFVIKGFYLPFDMPGGELVISENPYSSCFFCGGSGPESIIEVRLKSASSNFEVDELITVRGKMRINGTDPDHAIFILEDAEVVAR
jgi:hypothetical protein